MQQLRSAWLNTYFVCFVLELAFSTNSFAPWTTLAPFEDDVVVLGTRQRRTDITLTNHCALLQNTDKTWQWGKGGEEKEIERMGSHQTRALWAIIRFQRRVIFLYIVFEETSFLADIYKLSSSATHRTARPWRRVDVLVDAVENGTCVLLAYDWSVLKMGKKTRVIKSKPSDTLSEFFLPCICRTSRSHHVD